MRITIYENAPVNIFFAYFFDGFIFVCVQLTSKWIAIYTNIVDLKQSAPIFSAWQPQNLTQEGQGWWS